MRWQQFSYQKVTIKNDPIFEDIFRSLVGTLCHTKIWLCVTHLPLSCVALHICCACYWCRPKLCWSLASYARLDLDVHVSCRTVILANNESENRQLALFARVLLCMSRLIMSLLCKWHILYVRSFSSWLTTLEIVRCDVLRFCRELQLVTKTFLQRSWINYCARYVYDLCVYMFSFLMIENVLILMIIINFTTFNNSYNRPYNFSSSRKKL